MTRHNKTSLRPTMWTRVRTFLVSDDGPTAVEYCVMLALITLAIISSVTLMANVTASSFQDSADSIQGVMGSEGSGN